MIDGGLRILFRKNLPHFDWVTIETGGTGRGVPDSNACYNKIEFWIEYKQTDGWDVPLRPEQIGWLMRRSRAGGRTFIAVRRWPEAGKRRIAADDLYLFRGADAILAKQQGLRLPTRLGIWSEGPSAWNWREIGQLLIGIR